MNERKTDPMQEPIPPGQRRYLLTLPPKVDPVALRDALVALAAADGVVRTLLNNDFAPGLGYGAYVDLTEVAVADLRKRIPRLAVENAVVYPAPTGHIDPRLYRRR